MEVQIFYNHIFFLKCLNLYLNNGIFNSGKFSYIVPKIVLLAVICKYFALLSILELSISGIYLYLSGLNSHVNGISPFFFLLPKPYLQNIQLLHNRLNLLHLSNSKAP